MFFLKKPSLVIYLLFEIASDIYPKDIPLEQSSIIGTHDSFLDLDISVLDNKFVFKIFHKVDLFNFEMISFPYLESNVPSQICYYTFFSSPVGSLCHTLVRRPSSVVCRLCPP